MVIRDHGSGSSPGGPTIRTTSKAVLRRMLRRLDEQLHVWDLAKGLIPKTEWMTISGMETLKGCEALDARRREVRRKLKESLNRR